MTDVETNNADNTPETEERKMSDYAKLRASLKSKYEWQINDLQARIDELEAARFNDQKAMFKQNLISQGYNNSDFDEFLDTYWAKYDSPEELTALYKGMHEAPVVPQAQPQVQQPQPRWPQSVIAWSNPTLWTGWKKLEDLSVDELIKLWTSMIK